MSKEIGIEAAIEEIDKSISKVKDKDEKKVLELSVKVIKAYLTRTLENEKKAAIAFKALFKLTNTNNLEQLNEWEPPQISEETKSLLHTIRYGDSFICCCQFDEPVFNSNPLIQNCIWQRSP